MSHGFMGIGPSGFVYLAGFTAFFAYLGTSFKGPDRPKHTLDKELVDIVKPYQPGIVAEHYYRQNAQDQVSSARIKGDQERKLVATNKVD